jgi:ribosome-binding ATPase YchF (GTP1/OBG family)
MRAVICKFVVAIIAITAVAVVNTPIVNAQEDLQAASDVIRQQKKIYIAKIMELTAQEKEAFWPLYAEYESGLSQLRAERIKLAMNFLQSHGNLSDAEAIAMLNQKLRLDGADLKFKQGYVAKFMQVLPGRKVVRFYQAENRFDTAATAELYRNIPVIR